MESERPRRTSIPITGKLDDRKNVKKEPLPPEDLPENILEVLEGKRNTQGNEGRSTIQKLEGKHVLSMLLYINEMSPVLKSDIYNNVSRSAGMVDKLNDLYEMGLVKIYLTVRSGSNVVVITDLGRKIAQLVWDTIDLIDNYEGGGDKVPREPLERNRCPFMKRNGIS
jgi:hypothetical protein